MTSRSIRVLLRDPAWKKQLLTAPRLHANLAHGNPWRVWALSTAGKWSKVDTPDYARAFAVVKAGLAKRDDAEVPVYQDFSIVSLRQMFAPKPGVTWGDHDPREAWCSRCRRPVIFGYFMRHHACANSPMRETLDADPRCPYCGIRRGAMKEY